MSVRSRIMDKYWLDFLASPDIKGDCSTWYEIESAFWFWFYDNKMNGVGNGKLENYL